MHKLAIIGYGGMGEWHHKMIDERKIRDLSVKGAYDIQASRQEQAVKNGIIAYESVSDILNDKEIDIVTIAAYNDVHKELTIRALNAGKHVVCEKPVTMEPEDLIEMMEAAKKAGRVFSIHQNRRWDRDYNIVKKSINEGLIGKPFYIESRVQGSRGTPHGWRCIKKHGGGMMLDWGVHLIDQLMWLIDSPVTEVYAHLLSIKNDEVDDNFKLMLKFKNGISALVQVDTFCFINLPRWHVSGDIGTLVINDWDCSGKILRANSSNISWDEVIVHTEAGPTRTMAPRPVETIDELALPKIHPKWDDYYNNIVDVIENKAELIVKPSEALRVVKVMKAAFESSEKGICIKGEF